MRFRFCVLFAFALASGSADGYETTTHTAVSTRALQRSTLGNRNTHSRLGLLDYDETLGRSYFDLGAQILVRETQDFERSKIEETRQSALEIPEAFTIPGWVLQGAIREDDNSAETPGSDEPGGVFSRVFGHFFDPISNSGLHNGINVGSGAPDWALAQDAWVKELPSLAHRQNHFKVSDAIEAMWRAITLKRRTGPASFDDDVWPTGNSMTAEAVRNAYWATTFRAIGDSAHLLQDMAQPQHTRNDMHSGRYCVLGQCPVGDPSFIEFYIEARTLRATAFRLGSQVISMNSKPLEYDGYSKPSFATFREYYGIAAPTAAENTAARGLANYTNRNFYSAGTIESDEFPSPPPAGIGLAEVTLATPVDLTDAPIEGKVKFKVGSTFDSVTNSSTPSRKMLAVGLWDQALKKKNVLFKQSTLNYYIYDDQAALLIPRAVGYTEGFIDFFFRGKLSVTHPPEGLYGIVDHRKADPNQPDKGFSKIKLNVANATDAFDGIAQEMNGGALAAVVKFHRNTCYNSSLSGEWGSPDMVASKGSEVFEPPSDEHDGCRSVIEEIVVSEILTGIALTFAPQTFEFSFASNPIPINATDVYLQVVYRGAIGAEPDSVAVETKDIGEPYFVAYLNATDYAFCHNGSWKLLGPNAGYPADVIADIPDANTRYPVLPMTDVSIGYGSNTGAGVLEIAHASSIPPGKYIRYAALADLGTNWSVIFDIGPTPYGINHNIHPTDLSLTANQVYRYIDEGTGQPYPAPRARKITKVRKHYTAGGAFVHYQHGDVPCAVDALIPMESPDIPVPELLATEIVGPLGQ